MLLRTDAFRDFDRLTARVFDTAQRGTGAQLDAYRDGDAFVIAIDLPGVDPAGIEATVDRRVLTVRAERKPTAPAGAKVVVRERPTGVITRQVVLAESLDADQLEARYSDGVLTLRVPVKEQAKPRRIAIVAGGDQAAGDPELNVA
ncbi:HSP20 family protein [Krasilnikovia cinnamomea]|uniref:HSP20 family protein n=1 Tax=Krasilnikovia cinnamomea TaxID=349313 RepID=A0A4Q7ZGK3_9ACTN|nr:Hsp20/alpha crystallin family protein [Krasilnikovia cinnamomea]RZU49313.1 HSP20 family protein [Krasilnikovia cinnamomea]